MKSAPAEPVGDILWFRAAQPHARWRKVLTTRDRGAAVALINGPGDWWVAAVHDERLLEPDASKHRQPTLFD